jgi:hypothetical protein
LLKDERVVEVNSLASDAIVIVKRKHSAKGELNPSPRRRNSAVLIHMSAANSRLQDDRLIANMPPGHIDVEVGKALE